MSKLEPRIEAVRAQYDLPADAFWQIPQNRQWVCKHAALEVVATKANVEWLPPQIIEADTGNAIAALVVTGRMGERVEWSTGEASPKNNKNAYPWAMAEKRAKDRVVLKLVGIHGLVYSEDEMPSDMPTQPAVPEKSSAQLKREGSFEQIRDSLANEMLDVFTFGQFEAVKAAYRSKARTEGWNKTFLAQLGELFAQHEEELHKRIDAENNTPGAANDGYGRELMAG